MALSGYKETAIGSHWKLRLEWTATQSTSANTSTVTAKLYFIADSYGATSTSASKTASITIAGTTTSNTASGLAKVSAGQKKLICTATKTISHASDGTGSFTLSGSFALNLTLSGTSYSTVSVASTTYTLNTIPRKSTLVSGQNWTAGSNTTIKINRASSSFTHTVTIVVNGTTIKTITGVGASTTVSFSTAENTNIFKALAQTTSKNTTITVTTYSGNTSLGSNSYTGTCTCPTTSTMTFPSSFDIGTTISGVITRKNSAFVHNCQIFVKGGSSRIGQLYTGAGTSWSFNTSTIASTLYAQTPNSNTLNLELRMYTMYNGSSGVQVGAMRVYYLTAKVINSNPNITGTLSYYDNSHSGVTGNNQYIVQNLSSLVASITSEKATALNGATMSHYVFSCGNKSVKVSHVSGALTTTLGTIDANSNTTLTCTAYDSRGNSSSKTISVTMLPFEPTTIYATMERNNNFESTITCNVNGTFSPLYVDGVVKHAVGSSTLKYRMIEKDGVAVTQSYTTLAKSGDHLTQTWTATQFTTTLDTTSTAKYEFYMDMPLCDAVCYVTVKKGQPLFALDTNKNSIGFNDIPTESNQILINGSVKFGANNFASKQGAVNLNNSDVINANLIRFADKLQSNNNEGFQFPNADGTTFTNLYAIDGQLWLQKTHGSSAVVNVGNADIMTKLFEGVVYPVASWSVTLPRTVANYPTGLVFIWCDYTNSTANAYDWFSTFVPKNFLTEINSGGSHLFMIPINGGTDYCIKRLYIQSSGTVIKGHDDNSNTTNDTNVVLRYIYAI